MDRNMIKSVLREQAELFARKDRGIERDVLKKAVKLAPTPFAVVISGLRRVGKSTLLLQIAQTVYGGDCYFVNFEDERLSGFTASDFDFLHQALIELYGEKHTFFFDEVQNIPDWELFCRRLIDTGNKLYITGSNTRLLRPDLGTKLTGRYVPIELYPFSFREFLRFWQFPANYPDAPTTTQRARLSQQLSLYETSGGIPDHLKYPFAEWPKTIYQDILYRDVAARHHLDDTRALKELSFYLLGNVSHLMSYNKMKELVKLGSVTTVKEYIDFLSASWLFFVVSCYSPSIKKQQIAAKKIYSIDTGLIHMTGFSFSPNHGALMENIVFLELRRRGEDAYYYKTGNHREVDFYIPKKRMLLQACSGLDQKETYDREVESLASAMRETGIRKGFILTQDHRHETIKNAGDISVVPITQWLLTSK